MSDPSETRTATGELLPLPERRKIYRRRWYQKNKDQQYAASRKREAEDPERFRAYKRKWIEKNREYDRLRAEKKNRIRFGLPEPTRPRPEHCECCGGKNKRALALDHCHKTGAFRGWLCDRCNLGLGQLGDSLEALQKAVEYLKRALQ